MSEKIPAYIEIGGTVSKSLIEELVHLINQECLGFEWGDPQDVSVNDVYNTVDGVSTLALRNDASSYGEFE